MNRKQLFLILIAVVVLGGWGLWLRHRDVASFATSQGRMGQKLLGDFDVNAVAQVAIKQGTNELNLVKQDEVWTVRERAGYPANYSEVSDFLRKAWELKVVQPVAVGPSQLPRLELTLPGSGPKAGTLVELKDKAGKVLKTLLIGKKHLRESQGATPGDEGWPDGRYVMADNKPESVSLVSETFSSIEPKPESWLNKDFFKVEKVKSVAVTYQAATNSWKLERETEIGELKLVDAKPSEKVDNSKVSGIPTALSYPSFNDVVADPKPEVTGLEKPTVAVLQTFDNFTYTVKVGNKSGEDSYYATVNVAGEVPKERSPGKDEKPADKEKLDKEFKDKVQHQTEKLKQEQAYTGRVYLVSKWTLDSLLKERGQLMAEAKSETSAKPAAATSDDKSGAVPDLDTLGPLAPPKTSDLNPAPLPPKPPEPKVEPPAKPAPKN